MLLPRRLVLTSLLAALAAAAVLLALQIGEKHEAPDERSEKLVVLRQFLSDIARNKGVPEDFSLFRRLAAKESRDEEWANTVENHIRRLSKVTHMELVLARCAETICEVGVAQPASYQRSSKSWLAVLSDSRSSGALSDHVSDETFVVVPISQDELLYVGYLLR